MNERILNLLSLCLQAKEKGHDCFFDYSPHVQSVSIRSYEGGWKQGEVDENGEVVNDYVSKKFYIYVAGDNFDKEEADARFEQAEAYLKGLIA
jgi:hypothetical protein